MGLTRFVAAYVAVAVLAVGAALVTLLAAPKEIAPAAAATVALSSVSLALAIRQAAVDRGDLHVKVTLERFGVTDEFVIQARAYNHGRRPVRVEELGFAADKSRTDRCPSWMTWGKVADDPIPLTLGESESQRVWTWPNLVARYYVRFEPPAWLFATRVDGRPLWSKLPPSVRVTLAEAWPEARDSDSKERAAEVEKPGELDEYGQAVRHFDTAG